MNNIYVMMKKYIIEGNIDFYSEININNENKNEDNLNYDNICFITYEPLIDNFVTMECRHKFNYIPLYNDLIKQKYFTNIMEESRLKINEIRCPYCRSISTQLIPFYENFCIVKDVFVRKIIGVNNYNLTGNIDYREKSLWVNEQIKIQKYTQKQIKEDAKQAKLKAKEEKRQNQEAKLKEKGDAKQAKLKEKEEKRQNKENKLKAKEDDKQAKLKAKEVKNKAKEEKRQNKEAKLKANM